MRITENRIIELSALRLAENRERLARSSAQVSSGLAVETPSDDPAAWAQGKRASAQLVTSKSRGEAIRTSIAKLTQVDQALAVVGDVVSRARELAVAGANGTQNADSRIAMAHEVRASIQAALQAANSRAPDGEYLLAGHRSESAPFDGAGVYVGDANQREIELGGAANQVVSIPGSRLTAAHGVDVFAQLEQLAAALETNDVATIQGLAAVLDAAGQQVSRARSESGSVASALLDAESARGGFELLLQENRQQAVEIDAVSAASELALHSQALELSQAVLTNVIDTLAPR